MRVKFLILLLIVILLTGCSITKSTINISKNYEFNNKLFHYVALMPTKETIIDNETIELIDDEIYDCISSGYYNATVFSQNHINAKINKAKLNADWEIFWNDYLETGFINTTFLDFLGKTLKVDLILQCEVIDIKKTFGIHRKVIGETTAQIKLTMFSTKSGAVIWEAISLGTQGNAHSDQSVPASIEAVEVALDELLDNLPFASNL